MALYILVNSDNKFKGAAEEENLKLLYDVVDKFPGYKIMTFEDFSNLKLQTQNNLSATLIQPTTTGTQTI